MEAIFKISKLKLVIMLLLVLTEILINELYKTMQF